jgi:hypothetical protein
LRVNGDAESARQRLDATLGESVPGAVDSIHKMESRVAARAFPFRMAYWVASVLSALSILLTISGIYGVLSWLVEQRQREIGARGGAGGGRLEAARLGAPGSARFRCGAVCHRGCSR